jgi:deazaflavin-dependent oxidoreductase (nitroreductase family)
MKRWLVRRLQKWLINPVVRRRAGAKGSRFALIETRGRRTGQPRLMPVGGALDGNVFWIVAEHGQAASYVRNLEANARVRIKVDGSWHAGTAQPMPNGDPLQRLRLYNPRTAAEVKQFGTSLLTVRVDFDRADGPG